MGTRHMIAVINDGKYRVAQYGQWDGYPSGQGLHILSFLTNGNVEALKKNSLKCSFISEEEYKELVEDYTDGDKFFSKYPQFSRDTSADILRYIAESENGLMLWDDYNFAADSLFCEWAYVIDFDKNTFEVYEGFNSAPLEPNERFFGMVCPRYADKIEDFSDIYYPVKHRITFFLTHLPTIEEFLSEFEPPSEEGENNE